MGNSCVSDSREQDDLPFERSSIAAIGARRTGGLFGLFARFSNGAGATDSEEPEPGGFESGPLHPGMLEGLARSAGGDTAAPQQAAAGRGSGGRSTRDASQGFESGPLHPGMLQGLALEAGESSDDVAEETATRVGGSSLLALDPSAIAPAEAGRPRPPLDPGHLVEHSILDELAGLEERPTRTFPIERAILISLFAHVAFLLLLILMPERNAANLKGKNFLEALYARPEQDNPIPISFPDAPGPARPNPKRSPLSDADRRAGGGDPAKPKSDTPFVPPERGVAGLAPGPRAPRIPGSQVPSRPRATAEAQRRPPSGSPNGTADAQRPAESKSAERKASEFPTADQQTRLGQPTETTKLAGLDQAIREAARGTVGGEGGSPAPNPNGGFVDSGPLSFDTTWYDWGPYAAEMVRRIKLHWDVPELARLGWKGSLTVRFFIMADGTVADAKIVRASSIPPFDHAAFQAIVTSSPFRPLPKDLLAAVPGKDREGITVTFFYNMRMDEEETGAPGPPKKSP
jgi:TonB family protein